MDSSRGIQMERTLTSCGGLIVAKSTRRTWRMRLSMRWSIANALRLDYCWLGHDNLVAAIHKGMKILCAISTELGHARPLFCMRNVCELRYTGLNSVTQ